MVALRNEIDSRVGRVRVPIGDIAVKLLRSPRVALFTGADTVCQLYENCRITVCSLRHVAIAYPCVGFTRNSIRRQASPTAYVAMDSPEQPAAQ
jgi:hypothetical protein